MRKMQFFYENMLENFLGFDRMHEKKIVFVKGAINLKYLRFFENCFLDFF
jgi:hypothetical protein